MKPKSIPASLLAVFIIFLLPINVSSGVLYLKNGKAIANAKGIPLENKHIEMAMAIVDRIEYNTTASMQRDFMEGKPSELQNFNGYIVEQGKLLNISTPVNSFTYQCLLPQELKARKQL